MARLSFLILLATVFSGLCSALPSDNQQEVLTTPQDSKLKWSSCGTPSDPVHIETIEILPDPPLPGQDLTVTVTGTADETIEEGAYADVVVKVGVIKILQKEIDVCEEARNAKASIQCPVEEGRYNVSHTVTLPKEIPPAPFKVNVQGYTVEDDSLVCLDLEIDFRKQKAWLGF